MKFEFESETAFKNAVLDLKKTEVAFIATSNVHYSNNSHTKNSFSCDILSHEKLIDELLVLKYYNPSKISSSSIFIELFITVLSGETNPFIEDCYNTLYNNLEI